MTVEKKIGQGIGGFMLSLAATVLTGVSLQLILSAIWAPPQSFLVSYGSVLAISIIAITLPWFCLLKYLRNKAMIRGVWYQIYAFLGMAAIGLIVALFF